MKTQTAIEHFKTPTALANALGIKQSSIYSWGENVPPLRQIQLERLTGGELKAEFGILPQKARKAKQ